MCDKNIYLNSINNKGSERQSSCSCPGAKMSRYLQPFTLLLLMEGPSHGYDMLDELARMCPGEELDPATLYKNLRKMEEEGFVTSEWDTENPGPARRVYKITELGEEVLHGWSLAIKRNKETLKEFLKRYTEIFSKARSSGRKRSK